MVQGWCNATACSLNLSLHVSVLAPAVSMQSSSLTVHSPKARFIQLTSVSLLVCLPVDGLCLCRLLLLGVLWAHLQFVSCVLCLQVSEDTLTSIFGSILNWHLQAYPSPVKDLSKSLVAATLALYNTAFTKLLPTPAKSHYLFNLRDFARVIQVGWGYSIVMSILSLF